MTAVIDAQPTLVARVKHLVRLSFFPWGNACVTIAIAAVLFTIGQSLVNWLVLDAVFFGGESACRENGEGYCWPFIWAKLRFILLGFFPSDELWRATVSSIVLLAGYIGILVLAQKSWKLMLGTALIALILPFALMRGGFAGMEYVPTELWSGFPLILLVSIATLLFSFPVGMLLALGRQSKSRFTSLASSSFIELFRSIPLISILFLAAFVLPVFFKFDIDRLIRAIFALTLYTSAQFAEVIRSGLQTIHHGQYDASKALGLGYWRMNFLVILPQALRTVAPALVSTAIICVKDTAILSMIGLSDLIVLARTAASDTNWLGFESEAFFLVALVYLLLCAGLSWIGERYS